MKKYLLFIIVLFNIANCSELAYPSWYCDTYEDKYYIYSCGYANSKYDSINSSLKNISDYIYNKLDFNETNELIVYRKFDTIYTSKVDKIFFTKVSLNKNELLALYKEKLDCVNEKINDFINKDESLLIKYSNRKFLYELTSTAKNYTKIINFLSKNESKIGCDTCNKAEKYIRNLKLNINVKTSDNIPNDFLLFLRSFFEINGIIVDDNSENVLYVDLKTRKDFVDKLYYLNANFEFKLMYNDKIQMYDYVNVETNSADNYDDALSKVFIKIREIIAEKSRLNIISIFH